MATFKVNVKDGELIVTINGRLEFSDHNEFRDQIVAIAEGDEVKTVHIHISDLEHIDSAGMGLLLLLKNLSDENNASKPVIIHNPQGQVEKMFFGAKFDQYFIILKEESEKTY